MKQSVQNVRTINQILDQKSLSESHFYKISEKSQDQMFGQSFLGITKEKQFFNYNNVDKPKKIDLVARYFCRAKTDLHLITLSKSDFERLTFRIL